MKGLPGGASAHPELRAPSPEVPGARGRPGLGGHLSHRRAWFAGACVRVLEGTTCRAGSWVLSSLTSCTHAGPLGHSAPGSPEKLSFPAGFYAGSVAVSPAPLASGADPGTFDEVPSAGGLFASVGSCGSTPQHPPLLPQPRGSGAASPAPPLCARPRRGGAAQGPLPDANKGDLPPEAGFSDPEGEAKRRIVFTVSAGGGSTKQSPPSKPSPLPTGGRGDGSQGHGQDSRKRGRRKRAAAGTPGLSSGVSPKRRALPSVAGLFTQSSGSPLNLNSMVRLGTGGGGRARSVPSPAGAAGLPEHSQASAPSPRHSPRRVRCEIRSGSGWEGPKHSPGCRCSGSLLTGSCCVCAGPSG